MKKSTKTQSAKQSDPVRASISFPSTLYVKLNEVAAQKKVSLAWVVRDAVERYLEFQTSTREKRQG